MAQSIKGVVLNNQGKAVANATVDLEGSDQVTTNDKGEFEISGLNNGLKELHISAPGYAPYIEISHLPMTKTTAQPLI